MANNFEVTNNRRRTIAVHSVFEFDFEKFVLIVWFLSVGKQT